MSEIKISKEDLKDNLRNILQQDYGFVCAIKGKWGVGKTYFIKNFLEEYKKENKKENKEFEYVYISLFNKRSLSDIEKEIILNISAAAKFSSKFKDIFDKIHSTLDLRKDEISLNLGFIGSILNIGLSILEKKDFEKITIVFDDLERLSDNLPIKEVLGLIAHLKEEKDCKIIIIFNEDKILNRGENNYRAEDSATSEEIFNDQITGNSGNNNEEHDHNLEDNSKKIYLDYKEKVIDFEFLYNPSVEENFELIRDKSKCYTEEIRDFFVRNKINNIRNMLQVIYVINNLCKLNDKLDRELLKESIIYLIPFIYLKKVEGKNTNEIDKILYQYMKITISEDAQNNDIKKTASKLKSLFPSWKSIDLMEYSLYPEFVTPFFDYVNTEVWTEEIERKVKNHFKDELARRKNLRIKEDFERERFKYIYCFSYEDENFIKNIWSKFENYKEKILEIFSLSELYEWMTDLLKIDEKHLEKYKSYFSEVLINYLENKYSDSNEILYFFENENIRTSKIINRIDEFPELKKYLENKQKERLENYTESCKKIYELMLNILYSNSWNREDITILNGLKKERIFECIKQDSKFVEILIEFISDQRKYQDSSFEKLIKTFDELVEELKKSEEKIRKKIEIWERWSRY
ncbi:P-loop NTPase fold protein [Persephonella sp.]